MTLNEEGSDGIILGGNGTEGEGKGRARYGMMGVLERAR